MKKRFLPIATAISAAALLAACSQTDLIDDGSVKGNGTADNNAVTFSTYTAKNGGTRAGYQGDMTNATLKEKGFGVFAYYTKGDKYGTVRNTSATPNFMYNQKVHVEGYTVANPNEGDFTYSPLKYWPNEYSTDDVGGGATGVTSNGNVSFFAYAPYVAVTNESKGEGAGNEAKVTSDGTSHGIVGMTANDAKSDPKITYELGSNVDLLWGTYAPKDGTGATTNSNQAGKTGKTAQNGGDAYEQDIVEGKTVAADLNKQKVDNKVEFNFIHALAGIGGSTDDTPDNPNDNEYSCGFKVQLEIDAERGGDREKFEDGNYKTIVTIESVTIKNTTVSNDGITGDIGELDEGKTTIGNLRKSAGLNLATGQWDKGTSYGDSDNAPVDQTIGTYGDGHTDKAGEVSLNPKIAEFESPNNSYFNSLTITSVIDYFKNTSHPGVTKDLQNVYANNNVSPLLFIPGDRPVLQVKVKYIVRTYDEALNGECSEVINEITKAVVFPKVEMNKHYTLIMHLGLTSVNFTATVAPWEKGDGNPNTVPGTGSDGGQTNVEDVEIDLPINVVSQPNPGSE